MGLRTTIFSPEEFYHLYSRGVDRRSIFIDNEDKKRFVRLLFLCNSKTPVVYKTLKNLRLDEMKFREKLVEIGAYCLMNNHFHILIKEVSDGGVVKFMSKLLTAYSLYFNKKYNRTGSLFSSEFKSSCLDTDEYLKYIFAYIHLNPLKILDPDWREKTIDKKVAKKYLDEYTFSSYPDYIFKKPREESLILGKESFPDYFNKEGAFKKYVFDWLNFDLNSSI